ncbi:MAG TPA: hypothetical protein VJP02_05550 [Candidatus Sulfotelmatobacter sp.]|nr:hypothetical protein [Candidatus Sulfotelmatobacter sp.]
MYAPPYAPHNAEPEGSTAGQRTSVVRLGVNELRPHPSYIRHNLSVSAVELAALEDQGELAFRYPIVVTRERFVIDGYKRWELAKRKGYGALDCIERDFTLEESLEELVRRHGGSRGLTDFIRIELALDLEPHFREKARLNQQAGGQGKASSKLTEAQRIDSRREVARVANVCTGNVRKVKAILEKAHSSVQDAARTGEVSINLTEKWSHETHVRQLERLRQSHIERGIRRTARKVISSHQKVSEATRPVFTLTDLLDLISYLPALGQGPSGAFGSIDIRLVSVPGKGIYVTEELINSFRAAHGNGDPVNAR